MNVAGTYLIFSNTYLNGRPIEANLKSNWDDIMAHVMLLGGLSVLA